MTTQATMRTGQLNVDLGLDSDSDDRFGTTAVRNLAIQDAIRRMWPRMGMADSETVTPLEDTYVYEIQTLWDVVKVVQVDADGAFIRTVSDWSLDRDDSSNTLPGHSIAFPYPPSTDTTMTVWGYVPYTVPSADGDTLDVPTAAEWVVVAGARSFLYRRQLNQFATFERRRNENQRTTLSPEQLLTMQRDAEALYREGIAAFSRVAQTPRRAIRVRR